MCRGNNATPWSLKWRLDGTPKARAHASMHGHMRVAAHHHDAVEDNASRSAVGELSSCEHAIGWNKAKGEDIEQPYA